MKKLHLSLLSLFLGVQLVSQLAVHAGDFRVDPIKPNPPQPVIRPNPSAPDFRIPPVNPKLPVVKPKPPREIEIPVIPKHPLVR